MLNWYYRYLILLSLFLIPTTVIASSCYLVNPFILGDAVTPTCTSYVSATTGTGSTATGSSSGRVYTGVVVNTGEPSEDVCQFDIDVASITGDISGKTYTAYIYSRDGTALDVIQGTSDSVSGADISVGTNSFTFSPAVTLEAGDAIVFTTGTYDASNYFNVDFRSSNGDGGYGYYARWDSVKNQDNAQTSWDYIYELYSE